ncbi:MAG: Ldh family oxidoreductase, partial [Geminicoccaceae bacterium]
SYQTPDDLKGQVIGVGTADGAEVSFARGVLNALGMTESQDYEFLTVGDGGPATAAFTRGDVEAYAASTADAAILNQRGLAVRDITPEEFTTFVGNGYVTMRPTIEEDPELVEGFGRAIVRAQKFGLLAGVLNGAAFGRNVVDFTKDTASVTNTGQFVAAIAIEAFGDPDAFLAAVDLAFDDMRASAPLPGHDPVRIPGEGRGATWRERQAAGLPLHANLLAELGKIAVELEIAGPTTS